MKVWWTRPAQLEPDRDMTAKETLWDRCSTEARTAHGAQKWCKNVIDPAILTTDEALQRVRFARRSPQAQGTRGR
jgi:hypothetical protein